MIDHARTQRRPRPAPLFSFSLLGCVCLIATACSAAETASSNPLSGRRPNIVLVMTDDQGMGDFSCFGNPDLSTPAMDQLRDDSVWFSDFHVSPTCSPTRAALLTGRHEFRNGVTHTIFERERLSLNSWTFPQALQSAGYKCGIFGKWHLGDEDDYQPDRRGFDEVFIHGAGGIGQAYDCSCADVPVNQQHRYFDCVFRHNRRFVRTEGFCTDVFFDAAASWIDAARQGDQPFFAYIATNAPHSPFIAKQQDKQPFLDAGWDEETAARYGMIVNIDERLGQLRRQLQEWGLTDNTLLIFLTDNGQANQKSRRHGQPAQTFRAGLRGGKVTPYEGGTRVPCFWNWPGVLPENQEVRALTAHLDICPTLLEIAGAQPVSDSPALEGRSLTPLLTNADAEWLDRTLFTHAGRWPVGANPDDFRHRDCAVRTRRYRLVNHVELYDIQQDPGETTNIAVDHPEVVQTLQLKFDEWWSDTKPWLVNEDAPQSPERPFWTAYEQQLKQAGIPLWLKR